MLQIVKTKKKWGDTYLEGYPSDLIANFILQYDESDTDQKAIWDKVIRPFFTSDKIAGVYQPLDLEILLHMLATADEQSISKIRFYVDGIYTERWNRKLKEAREKLEKYNFTYYFKESLPYYEFFALTYEQIEKVRVNLFDKKKEVASLQYARKIARDIFQACSDFTAKKISQEQTGAGNKTFVKFWKSVRSVPSFVESIRTPSLGIFSNFFGNNDHDNPAEGGRVVPQVPQEIPPVVNPEENQNTHLSDRRIGIIITFGAIVVCGLCYLFFAKKEGKCLPLPARERSDSKQLTDNSVGSTGGDENDKEPSVRPSAPAKVRKLPKVNNPSDATPRSQEPLYWGGGVLLILLLVFLLALLTRRKGGSR